MGSLFKPKLPEPPQPANIPDPDDESIRRARTEELLLRRRQKGAQSTVLTDRAGPGGGEFSRTLLG